MVLAIFHIGEEKRKSQEKISTLECQLDEVKDEGASKDGEIERLSAKVEEQSSKIA